MRASWIDLTPQPAGMGTSVMHSRFVRYLQIVTSVHVAVLALLFCMPLFHHLIFWKKPQIIHPVEFTVVVPDQSPSGRASRTKDINAIIQDHKWEMRAIDRREKKLAEKREKERREREEAAKRAAAQAKLKGPDLGPPSKNAKDTPLSEDQIRKLLAMGARPGERNIVPDEEDRCFEMIRRAFYDAWAQPSYDEVGNATAEVEVRLQKDGSIFGVRMTKKSGNNILDTTVMQAAMSVKRVDNLTPAFLGKFEEVTVIFKVEPQ
jgi:outer membrane biosynthesis protein TonB